MEDVDVLRMDSSPWSRSVSSLIGRSPRRSVRGGGRRVETSSGRDHDLYLPTPIST